MRYFLVALIVGIIALAASVYFVAIPKAEEMFLTQMKEMGFETVSVSKTTPHLTGMRFDDISLDGEGFNKIEHVEISTFWPLFLIRRNVDRLEFNMVELMFSDEDIQHHMPVQYIQNFSNLVRELPVSHLSLKNIILSVPINGEVYRFLITGVASQTSDEKTDVFFLIEAIQKNLRFKGNISGVITDTGEKYDVVLSDLFMSIPFVKFSRADGWVSYSSNQETEVFGGQLMAGSGVVFDLPIQDVQLNFGKHNNYVPVVVRARSSGSDSARIMIDAQFSHDMERQKLEAHLAVDNRREFIQFLEAYGQDEATLINWLTSGSSDFQTSFEYLPDRRFPGGPYPVQLETLEQNGNIPMNGTILLYPETLDLRGTITGDDNALTFLRTLLRLPMSFHADQSLRLDGSLNEFVPN